VIATQKVLGDGFPRFTGKDQVQHQQIWGAVLEGQQGLMGRSAHTDQIKAAQLTKQSPHRLGDQQMIVDHQYVEHH